MAVESVVQQQILAVMKQLRAEKGDRFEAATATIFGLLPAGSGISKSTVDYHLAKLAEDGAFDIEGQGKGRPRVYVFSDKGSKPATSNGSAPKPAVAAQTVLAGTDAAGEETEPIGGRLTEVKAALAAVRESQRKKKAKIEADLEEWMETEKELAAMLKAAGEVPAAPVEEPKLEKAS